MFSTYKIAYVPIPKAANSSIRSALLPLLDIQPSSIEHIQTFRGFDKRRFGQCAHEIDESWFVFTVVRNPLSRIASAYQNKMVERQQLFAPFRKMGLTIDDDFRTFVNAVARWPKLMLNDHLRPQTMLLSRALMVPNLKVYKVEELATSWSDIRAQIFNNSGILLSELGSLNSSLNGWSRSNLYDVEIENSVRKIYRDDFDLFKYY